jgi:PAS domain S-box-containing protein
MDALATPLLREVIDTLPAEIVVIDAQGVVRLANQAWNRCSAGSGAREEQVSLGANYLDVCRRASAAGDSGAASVLQALQQVLDGHRDECVTEYPCNGPQGDGWFVMHARRLPAVAADGAPGEAAVHGGLIISHLDITARKRAEEALRQTNERFEAALRQSEVMIFEQDRELRYTWAYDPALGRPTSEVLGRRDADLLDQADDAERIEALKRRAMQEGVALRERVQVQRGGCLRSYDLTVQPRHDASGGLVGVTGAAVDVTERQRTDERLRDSEARYRQLLEQIEQGFCILQILRDSAGRPQDYRFLEVNSNFERHTGIADAVGNTVRERVPAIEQHWIDIYGRVARTGVSERIEMGSVALGRVFAVEAVAVGERGSDKVALLFSDITERRRAAADLGLLAGLSTAFAQSSSVERLCRQALLRVLRHFGATRASLCDVDDAAGRLCVFAGHRGEGPADEALVRPMLEHMSPQLIDELRSGLTVCIDDLSQDPRTAGRAALFGADDTGAMVFSPSLSDGRLAFLMVLAAPAPRRWRDDECALAGELAGRIHARIERARAEAAVRHSEARLRLAARTAEFGVHDYDLLHDDAVWSEELYAIAGLPPRSKVDLSTIWSMVHPTDRAAVGEAYRRAQDPAGDGDFTLEFRIVRPRTGETRWVAMRSRTMFEQVGATRRPVRNTGVVLDITARKRAEEHLRDDARRKDEFLAMLAHELRNPLAPIRSAVEVLGTGRPDAALVSRCRDVIDRQVTQMARLLDDLLELTRLARGRVNLQREVVSLGEVLELAMETARPMIEQRRHHLELVADQTPLRLLADKSRLTQVFANLLNNAAKYSHDGGRIRMTVTPMPGAVEVGIADEGIGIPPEMLDSVFELFVQASQARAHAPGGLGVGLSLARRLVDMHGGSIRVHSAGPGQGSEFIVRLPLHAGDRPAADAGISLPLAPPKGKRVLVVDDNVDAADTLALLLRAMGSEVRVVYDGASALTEAGSFLPEVVLLDLGMPGLDGFEVCRRLRALPGGMDCCIAAVSGWGQEQDRRHSAMAGFDQHFIKPVAAAALATLLQR